MSVEHIFKQALKLPKEERLKLISQLAESCVDEQAPAARESALRLLEKRRAAYEAGESKSIDLDKTVKGLREKIEEWTRRESSSSS